MHPDPDSGPGPGPGPRPRPRPGSGQRSSPAQRSSWTPQQLMELVAPARLGPGFRTLLGAAWVTALGDGILISAGPLLVKSQTDNAMLIALAAVAANAAWMLFGLLAGLLADRVNRQRMLLWANLMRIAILVGLTITIATSTINIGLLLVALFLLGIAETMEDTVAGTLLPMLVEPADLGLANSRFLFGFQVLNEFAGPSVGAFLFVAAIALPYAATTVCLAVGAVLVLRIRLPTLQGATDGDPAPTTAITGSAVAQAFAQVREGMSWLWHHDAVRSLALVVFVFNITFGAAWAVLVLYAAQRLHLPASGYGFLTSASAVGGVVGTMLFTRLERWLPLAMLLRIGLVIETGTHLVLALTTSWAVALVALFLFGIHASVWGSLSSAVRQRATPTDLLGRVGSVYMLGVIGGMLVGGLIGGALAQRWGITAPYWFGFSGSALFLAIMWRAIGQIAHADAVPALNDAVDDAARLAP